MTQTLGSVDILGAGPGALDFLIIAGQDLLASADVLIYDALIDPILLTLTKENCQCIPVGKRGGQASVPQAEINHLLVHHCQAGQRVLRLKSGDPLIFGRTLQEVEALTAAGCKVRVWPGLSSALSAPLLAGIPLTDPECSQWVSVVSGHDPNHLDWAALARCDTVVILMGIHHCANLVRRLVFAGKSADTPVAMIRWGGWPQQQVWVGTLAALQTADAPPVASPAVMVIGEVVALRDRMMAASPMAVSLDRPLVGRRVIVTRSAGQAGTFSDRLSHLGATVLEMPTLEIGPPSSWDALDGAIAQLDQYQWLVLTSTNGVEAFWSRLFAQGKDSRTLAGLKIAVVGRKTAEQLTQSGIIPDFIPPDYVADALVEHFPEEDLQGLKILFPRVESGGRDILVAALGERGAQVDAVAAYESRCPEQMPILVYEALRDRQVDAVTFTSSKTVQHFCQLLNQTAAADPEQQGDWQSWLDSVQIVSIGPQTSLSCQKQLGRVNLEAAEYTLEGMEAVLVQHFQQSEGGLASQSATEQSLRLE
jgi:uroporphyrinogen III methyltransferase / synthase